MYRIKDKAELGYWKSTNTGGGSIHVIYEFAQYDDTFKAFIKNLTDKLDHTVITDNEEFINISYRYILVNKCTNVLTDTLLILYSFINNLVDNIENRYIIDSLISITIELDNEELTINKNLSKITDIIKKYNDN